MQIKKFQITCLYSLYCKVSKELHSPLAISILYVLFFISLLTKLILFVVYWFPWQNFFCRIVKVFRPFNFVTIFFLALTSVIYTNSCRFKIFLGVYFTNTISFIQPGLSQKLTFSRNVFTPIQNVIMNTVWSFHSNYLYFVSYHQTYKSKTRVIKSLLIL